MKLVLSTLVTLGFSIGAFAEAPKVAQSKSAGSPASEQSNKIPPTEPPVNQAPETPVTTKSNDMDADIKPETEKALDSLKQEADAKKASDEKKKSKRKQK